MEEEADGATLEVPLYASTARGERLATVRVRAAEMSEAEALEMNRLMELLDRGAATEADLNRVKGCVSKFTSGESQNSVRILPSACFCCAARRRPNVTGTCWRSPA